jgi:hypothetical protein
VLRSGDVPERACWPRRSRGGRECSTRSWAGRFRSRMARSSAPRLVRLLSLPLAPVPVQVPAPLRPAAVLRPPRRVSPGCRAWSTIFAIQSKDDCKSARNRHRNRLVTGWQGFGADSGSNRAWRCGGADDESSFDYLAEMHPQRPIPAPPALLAAQVSVPAPLRSAAVLRPPRRVSPGDPRFVLDFRHVVKGRLLVSPEPASDAVGDWVAGIGRRFGLESGLEVRWS